MVRHLKVFYHWGVETAANDVAYAGDVAAGGGS